MNHLLAIPVFFIAILVNLISKKYKLKIFQTISKIVIILSVIYFIYEYTKYLGYDIIAIILAWF